MTTPHDEMPRPPSQRSGTRLDAAMQAPAMPSAGPPPGPFAARKRVHAPVTPTGRAVASPLPDARRFPSKVVPTPQVEYLGEVEVQLRRGESARFLEGVAKRAMEVRSAPGFESIALPSIVSVVDTFSGTDLQGSHSKLRGGFESVELRAESRFATCQLSPGHDPQAVAQALARLPEVERALVVPVGVPPQVREPLLGFGTSITIDGDGLENQWYLHACGIDEAWKQASGADVVIIDIDHGFLPTHQDLGSQIDPDRTFNAFDTGRDVTAPPDCGHGTAVIGIAAGAHNGVGLAGVAYEASLWLVQGNAGSSRVPGNAWSRGIEWARSQDSGGRRKVLVFEVQTGSGHSYEQLPSVGAAIRRAIAEGIVVCAAAGNGGVDAGVDESGNPFPETGSIVVGATVHDLERDRPADFSNWGPRVVVAAPGDPEHDVTCDASSIDAYSNGFGGTSGATPKVAGVVALMLEVNPELTHHEIRSLLWETGREITTEPGRPIGRFLVGDAAVSRARALSHGVIEWFVRGSDGGLVGHRRSETDAGALVAEPIEGSAQRMVTARNRDGSLELIGRGATGALWSARRAQPGGAWSPQRSLGGWIEAPTVAAGIDGALMIFGRGHDGRLWTCAQQAPNGPWGEWSSISGTLDAPVAVRRADGRVEVLGIGGDHEVRQVRRAADGDAGWDSRPLGGWVDRVTAIVHVDGRLEVFARGSDRGLWHTIELEPDGGWSSWVRLGGAVDRIVATRNADGRAEVFTIGPDHAVWHIWQRSAGHDWSAWHSLDGFAQALEVSAYADGRLVVFATDADSCVRTIEQRVVGEQWGDWMPNEIWADVMTVGRYAVG